jgi:hypothetical protein
VLRRLGRAAGLVCLGAGTMLQSKELRALGLPSAAERAFHRGDLEAARGRANDLLQLARLDPKGWNSGNARHKAHLILGRVALAQGDIEEHGREAGARGT